jgi:hypothetical protein
MICVVTPRQRKVELRARDDPHQISAEAKNQQDEFENRKEEGHKIGEPERIEAEARKIQRRRFPSFDCDSD